MKVQRNVKGLQKAAQKKRQEAFNKVEEGIQALIKEKRVINFNTVAEVADVSKAWLYKEPEIRQRIEHLREQRSPCKKTLGKHRASDGSLQRVVQILKERIKRLEAENQNLRRQNEVAYGRVLNMRDLNQQIDRLEAENARLRQQLEANEQSEQANTETLEAELQQLGVEMNSTLQRLISGTPRGIVDTAVQSLKEASLSGQLRNPGGFLNKAITEVWKPNESYQKKADIEEFNQWWRWAYSKGLVQAATQIDGVQHVLTAEDKWISYLEMTQRFPIRV